MPDDSGNVQIITNNAKIVETGVSFQIDWSVITGEEEDDEEEKDNSNYRSGRMHSYDASEQ